MSEIFKKTTPGERLHNVSSMGRYIFQCLLFKSKRFK